MKQNKISIKWKLFAYLAGFIAFILVILWLSQTVFLDDFYKYIKLSEIRSSSDSICKNINNEDLQTLVTRISQRNEVCILILDLQLNQIYSSDILRDCVIHKTSFIDQYRLYMQAKNNGGEYIERIEREKFRNPSYKVENFVGRVPPNDDGMPESIIYTKLVTDSTDRELMILINSTISPVSATVQTLKIQLICITLILLIVAVLLAFIISKNISKPIIDINRSAKVLATGNYDVKFNEGGYKEIAELGATLNYAAEELSKVESLRQELIANISHDLRTPLTLITGYGEVMRDLPGENTPENVQVIIDESKRLTTLVNDVLDISKFQSHTQELNVTEFDISETIEDLLNRYTKFTEQDGYTITFLHDENVVVKADELRISQVLYNLINNALTYTGDDKTVTVKQSVVGKYVKIEVIDTGDGIEADKLKYIWDRYYKVDKTHKRAAVGTGLGLSIVRSILDMHNEISADFARYGVESDTGKGSTFWFEIRYTSTSCV